MEGAKKQQQQHHHHHHFVLIHGVCHGAWCWYRVATALAAAGHRVTAVDMAGCGARPGRGEEVASFEEYSRPLLDAVAALLEREAVVLVAHSFGGQSLALAVERFPERVAAAVFVTATMPAAGKPMSYAFKQLSQGKGPDFFMDCTMGTTGDPKNPDKTFLFGPNYMARRVYQLSPPEDLTLGIAMVRTSRRFLNDETMNDGGVLTAARYGAARRVYVVAEDDEWKPAEMQRLMASWNPGTQVLGLQGADHMPMFSKPRELSELLMLIANNA